MLVTATVLRNEEFEAHKEFAMKTNLCYISYNFQCGNRIKSQRTCPHQSTFKS